MSLFEPGEKPSIDLCKTLMDEMEIAHFIRKTFGDHQIIPTYDLVREITGIYRIFRDKWRNDKGTTGN